MSAWLALVALAGNACVRAGFDTRSDGAGPGADATHLDGSFDALGADGARFDAIADGGSDAPCLPSCTGKACGAADGCGGTCLLACTDLVHGWSKRIGAGGSDRGTGIAIDAAGNVVVTGSFVGSVDFGGGVLTSAGQDDVFVASYDATGMHRWSQRFGDASLDVGNSVALDGNGNVAVTGYFWQGVDLGGGPLTSAGEDDVFVASYDSVGTHRWSHGFGDTAADYGLDVAIGHDGNVAIAGSFHGTVNAGGGSLTSVGSDEIFVASYDPEGAHRWSRSFGSAGSDYAESVVVDHSGNVIIVGYFNDTVDFGGGPLTSAGNSDIFVASYDAAGAHRWSKRFGGSSTDFGLGVAADDGGNVVVTGYFVGAVDFGGGPLSGGGSSDIFVASYDDTGVHRWSRSLGCTGFGYGRSAAMDASGNVNLTGQFIATIDPGGGPLTSAGGSDIFVASYDPTGSHRWSRRYGSDGTDTAYDVAVGGGGSVAITGNFTGTVDFGGGPLTSAGSSDVFVVLLTPRP